MDTRLLGAVRSLIKICRRQSDNARERDSGVRSRPPRRKGVIGVALKTAMQAYYRPYSDPGSRTSAFVVTQRSQKTAAAVAYLSGLLGAPLPCLAPGRKTLALAAWRDAREATARRLRFRPLRFVKTLRWITRDLDEIAAPQTIALLFSYWNYRMLLRRWRPAFFLCVSDLSPRRIAAACAANVTETPVLFFQDDWHHDTVPPFHIAAASVLNGTGLTAVRPSMCAGGIVTSRGIAPAAPHIRACPTRPRRFGVALNNYFDAEGLGELAQQIGTQFPGAEIIVRRHPRSRTQLRRQQDGIVEAPAGQSIVEFAGGCDVVLVGNSGVQINLLLADVAVVHVGSLDQLRFDTYGYVSAGIVYGKAVFDRIDVEAIDRFYCDLDWRRRFLAKLAFGDAAESEILPEAALRDWLTAAAVGPPSSDPRRSIEG